MPEKENNDYEHRDIEGDGDEGSYEDDSLLSFDDPAPKPPVTEKPELKPSPSDGALVKPGGMSVDDILREKKFSDEDLPKRKLELSVSAKVEAQVDLGHGKETDPSEPDVETPPKAEVVVKSERKLEIHTPTTSEGKWKIQSMDNKKRDMRVRTKPPENKRPPPEKVRVDHNHLVKLDADLKNELVRLREKATGGVIPGEFLEARKLLAEYGMLECETCKIQVEDTIGKIDYCPRCGKALDDHFGRYKVEWEKKHKHVVNFGVAEFGVKPLKQEKTTWELWKEEKGVDPDAELLQCPQCGHTKYDDPFVADRCPKCRIPLDLHLRFPRDSVRKQEAKDKGRRIGMDRKKYQDEKDRGKGE